MYPAAFTLVSTHDPDQVLAFGLEILLDGSEPDTAITYRHAPGEAKATIGRHQSAHHALRLYNKITPAKLIWAHDEPISAPSERNTPPPNPASAETDTPGPTHP